ncbi:MAG TPA: MBL fold metallo-hydrolase [Gemmataceae bacterium]|nr:MBL fold metallo-hydrolase [Gemmataceae bacterium]
MGLRFTVLASGSRGNASLLQAGSFGLLLDAGLGPRQLTARLAAVGASWNAVNALILTHTHSDHWSERTFVELYHRRIPVYCHPDHHRSLLADSIAFRSLLRERLVHPYDAHKVLRLPAGLVCQPLALRHDGGLTFGFRFEQAGDHCGPSCALGYVADLGCWDRPLAEALADVDLLALEFNHDVAMEYASGRQPQLIARVLGDEGHLSNVQAAALLREVLRLSTPGRLRHVVQLHLSQQCNRPDLAAAAARAVLADLIPAPQLHTARQDRPGPILHLEAVVPHPRHHYLARPSQSLASPLKGPVRQGWLPGLEAE